MPFVTCARATVRRSLSTEQKTRNRCLRSCTCSEDGFLCCYVPPRLGICLVSKADISVKSGFFTDVFMDTRCATEEARDMLDVEREWIMSRCVRSVAPILVDITMLTRVCAALRFSI